MTREETETVRELSDAADDTYNRLREFVRSAALTPNDAERLLDIASDLFHKVITRADTLAMEGE